MKKFGTILREARILCGLKGYELAKKAGVNPVYITQIEKHDKLPSPLVMKKISDVLKDGGLFEIYLKIKYPILHEIFKKDENDWNKEVNDFGIELVTQNNMTPERKKDIMKRVKQLITRTRTTIDRSEKILVLLKDIERKHAMDQRTPSKEQ